MHNTVAAPRVSIAAARRVSTRAFDSRHAPITMNTVSTSGNSSGSIDIPSAMPASTASSHEPRNKPNSTTASTEQTSPISATVRTMPRVSCVSRGVALTISPSAWPMRPMRLRAPVDSTRAMPCPRTTSVPANTPGRSSPPGVRSCVASSSGASAAAVLRTATDSPVSSDSSTIRSSQASTLASAATRSPSPSTMRSPRTTSRPGMRSRWPPRITSARGLVRSRSASSTRSLRFSWTIAIATEIDANASNSNASPRSPSSR